jgi:hypothetical protein
VEVTGVDVRGVSLVVMRLVPSLIDIPLVGFEVSSRDVESLVGVAHEPNTKRLIINISFECDFIELL